MARPPIAFLQRASMVLLAFTASCGKLSEPQEITNLTEAGTIDLVFFMERHEVLW